jgi:hypothetical protein
MEKAERQANLKYLQSILIDRADEELPEIVKELKEAVENVGRTLARRAARFGKDRKERGGRNRSEG